MPRLLIHKCVVYLLLALLSLQAAAVGRFALCAESPMEPRNSVQVQIAVQPMDHCAQMASMQAQEVDMPQSTSKATCWLGSFCMASFGAMALSAPFGVSPIQASAPLASSTPTVYLSIISDTPQRPPATL